MGVVGTLEPLPPLIVEELEFSTRDLGPGLRGDGGTTYHIITNGVKLLVAMVTSLPWSLPIDIVFPLRLSSKTSYSNKSI